ncbi:N-formylglutamate amidohydrolase [Roseicyclus mahoneyensis]|jgi:N-formylglutamate deformylase|uniref:N-formylglutamate amidohydrolase n=1 Tax=Roseicyclus mahoneyensis TaxID=164332 RepID=A0A316GII1_9RHOB|nr:N-formylglutamate amidohydrolase [Roseicyclus mahoneyensis]PWK59200.1 N-formylglutamate amidohydrolase [Roseicyclus mahoneyensis]
MRETIAGVLSVAGADSQRLPLIFDSPHSGTDYPEDFGHIADPSILRNAEDTHVADLWAGAVNAGALLLEAHFPRSYIDANRAPDDMDPDQIDGAYPGTLNPTVKSQLGIGLCWTRVPPEGGPMYDRRLTADQVAARIARYHRPYQSRLRQLLDEAHGRWGGVWHVNCHSMQEVASAMSTQDRGTPRPDFVLGDRDGAACEAGFTETVRAFLTARGYSVAVNDPYKGMELIRANGDPANARHSMQIEVNRKLYMDETTRVPNAGYADLKACFTALAAHLADHVEARLERTPAQ